MLEIIAPVYLREELDLKDGDEVELEIKYENSKSIKRTRKKIKSKLNSE
ncbi:MAG: DUF120 domain-containing protein [Candidatus Helarchaeota archaeon]